MVLALPGAGEAVGEARLQILQVLGRGCVCMDGRMAGGVSSFWKPLFPGTLEPLPSVLLKWECTH